MKENKIRTPVPPSDEGGADQRSASKRKSSKLPRALIGVLNGSFLARENVLRNMPFILFVAGLMLCYIAYGYWTERTVRTLDRTNTELKEMRAEYITVRSLLEKKEQQSEVADDIQGMGLKQSRVPPNRITVDEDLIEHPER
jgi:hypoxanthine-guanine phosphoribosyltransferase